MRIAHFCRFVPGTSGQYGTVKDIIKAELAIGLDAGFIATRNEPPLFFYDQVLKDDWLETKPKEWARDADIYVRHTMIPPLFASLGKPRVMVLHGRPENSFMLGYLKKMPIYHIIYDAYIKKENYAYVTFWKEYLFHWSLLIDKSILHYAPPPVDLERYCPKGEKFDWGQKVGRPNILIAELWREDTTPYNIIHAAAYYIKYINPQARLHICGYPNPNFAPSAMLGGLLQQQNIIGYVGGAIADIEKVYRAADLVLTPHRIATRIVRESLACDTPIVAGGCPYTPYNADPRDPVAYAKEIDRCWRNAIGKNKIMPRRVAQLEFNPKNTAKALKKIFDLLRCEKIDGVCNSPRFLESCRKSAG